MQPHFGIALGANAQVYQPVPRQLREQMLEHAVGGAQVVFARPVDVQLDGYSRFGGVALDAGGSRRRRRVRIWRRGHSAVSLTAIRKAAFSRGVPTATLKQSARRSEANFLTNTPRAARAS